MTSHSRRDCPSPRRDVGKCNTCHWFGDKHHKSCGVNESQKPNKESSVLCTNLIYTAPLGSHSIKVDDHTSEVLHNKQVTINSNHEVEGVIDSGSSICIMSESAGRRCKLNWIPDNTVIKVFGTNSETTTVGKTVVSMSIHEATLTSIEVYVVPESSHQHDLLVGRPWCEAPEVSFVKHGNNLAYYNTIAFPFNATSPFDDRPVEGALTVRHTTLIRSNETVLVTALVNGSEVQVPVMNNLREPVEVKANDILARREIVVQSSLMATETKIRQLTFKDIKNQSI